MGKLNRDKTLAIQVKVSEAELKRIHALMIKKHFTNISEFIRVTVLSCEDHD